MLQKVACRRTMFGAVALSAVLSLAASPTSAGATAAATVTTKSFARQFAPDEVVAARGEIWLVSAGNGNGPGCRAGRLDPAAMVVSTYRLASCGWNLTVGGGALYLETSVADVKHQAYLVHIERFSLSTHRSVVFRAVSVTMFLGSDIAHTQLAYADSSLWLYTMPKGSHSTALLKLSPTDGHVEGTWPTPAQLGGAEPLIARDGPYLWLAGGPGTSALARDDLLNGSAAQPKLGSGVASVYDMTTMKGHLYLQYLAYGNRARNGAPLRNYISELSAGGTVLKVSPPEPTGAWLTALGATIYAVGAGNTCDSGLVIWRVAPTTLRTTPVATIQTPGNPCLGVGAESGRSVAAAAGSLFVLYSFASDTTIYRVTPAS